MEPLGCGYEDRTHRFAALKQRSGGLVYWHCTYRPGFSSTRPSACYWRQRHIGAGNPYRARTAWQTHPVGPDVNCHRRPRMGSAELHRLPDSHCNAGTIRRQVPGLDGARRRGTTPSVNPNSHCPTTQRGVMADPRETKQGQAGDSGPEAIKADGTTADAFSPPRGEPFPIVGVGSSAGGLDAVTQLLRALPDNTGMAFVLVQHLDPYHKSELAGILTAETTMPIHIAKEGIPVRPDEVYIIPPNAIMTIEDGKLRIAPRKPGLSLPIDAFFESLARAQSSRAIGVVLSGNASDGSQGVRAIKGECGITFAQDEASAAHSGMPRNAVATGAIDYVLPPAEIARELVHLSRHPFLIPDSAGDSGEEVLPEGRNGELKKVLSLLRNGTKVDFTHYKQTTIRRRIGRRMMVCRSKDLAEYALYLQKHPEEIRELYRDLLINVTSFFRDPEVFAVLGRLLRDILPNRNTGEPFRVWTAGCATGEELYSLAICLREILEQLNLHTPLQLFGTDISDFALGRARSGAYPENIAQDVSQERLNRYFTRSESGYRVAKSIRESCIFARQNVAKDPPFAHMDLISCRNLLIYMDASLQKQV